MWNHNAIQIEACVARIADAVDAERAGADRIEINSALELDGLTPSIGLVHQLRSLINIPLIAMLRPHHLGFCYDLHEQAAMLCDARLLIGAGVDGLACGALHANGKINDAFMRQVRDVCGEKQLVFHRAFDRLADLDEGAETLIDLGVDRVLTSGGKETAESGLHSLHALVDQYGDRIEILPAGGITDRNAIKILTGTGCRQIHGSFRTAAPNQQANPQQIVHDFQSLRRTRNLLHQLTREI